VKELTRGAVNSDVAELFRHDAAGPFEKGTNMSMICRFSVMLLTIFAMSNAFGGDRFVEDDAEAIKSSFEDMSQRAASGAWQTAAELMTPEAADEVCAQMLLLCLGIRDSEFPMSIPELDDARDEIESVLRDYQLDKIDLPVTMFRFAGQDDQDEADLHKQAETNLANAKQALANVDDRWKLMAELQSAIEGLPFGQRAGLGGEISGIEIVNDTAEVTVKPQPPKQNDQSGVRMQVVGPPRIVNYRLVDGQWLYAGINREKTDAEMRKFQESFSANPGGADF
jgi:hypothetical protein